ncbi:hypothetical protein LY13_002346 [Prauserella aidingensis]|nr:hypothetical protein [Prauserella aidingensis]
MLRIQGTVLRIPGLVLRIPGPVLRTPGLVLRFSGLVLRFSGAVCGLESAPHRRPAAQLPAEPPGGSERRVLGVFVDVSDVLRTRVPAGEIPEQRVVGL